MTDEEKFAMIRDCIYFTNNVQPYITNDDQCDEIIDFLYELEKNHND